MSKRRLKITTEAIITEEDYHKNLNKKLKLLNDRIAKNIIDLEENVEADNHEVSKFLLIFGQLTKTMISGEDSKQNDETDGIVSDTISIICNLITDLLKNNIDQLSVPTPVKASLKILKKIFRLIKEKQIENNATRTKSGTEYSHRTASTEEGTEYSHRTTSTEETSTDTTWEETSSTSWERGEEQRSDSGEE